MLLIFVWEKTRRLCSILLAAASLGEENTCDFHFLNIPIVFKILKIDMYYLGKEKKYSGGKTGPTHSWDYPAIQNQDHLERGIFLLEDKFPSNWD